MRPDSRVPATRLTVALACLAACAALAGDRREPSPLAQAGNTYVAIHKYGCYGNCPAFELYVFANGHVVFRGGKYRTKRLP